MIAYCAPAQGAFRLDREGIQQDSLLRKSRYLRWENVERVKWSQGSCCLKGKDISISVAFTPVSSKNALRAKAFVEGVLAAHFDLSIKKDPAWSFDPNFRSIIVWISKIMGLSIFGAVLIIGPLALSALLGLPRWLEQAWFMLSAFGGVAILAVFSRKAYRVLEKANPTWRLRRSA
jgi:hypothetical protein